MSKARDLASAAPAPSTVSATELGYLDGVSSAIQTQINAKASTSYVDTAVAGVDLTNVQRIVPVDSNISVPGAPTSVSGTTGDTESAVSFVAPTSNGGSTILSYTVISSPGNIKKSGTSSPITITGLTNGTAYTFTVKAHNIAGSSVASSASASVTPLASISINYLVVAGGGAAAGGDGNGGGGAGGLRSSVTATGGGGSLESAISLSRSTNYTVTVGAGGSVSTTTNATKGSNSVFSTITSNGGGASPPNAVGSNNTDGGSGAGNTYGSGAYTKGVGTANQGYGGGEGAGSSFAMGGGGGGAGAAGTAATTSTGGNGGNGVAVSITGSSVTYAGGGGGGVDTRNSGAAAGSGGSGGGGNASTTTGSAGTANTGGGGGGGSYNSAFYIGGNGGSGVVILRWLTADGSITVGAGLTADATGTDGSYSYKKFTAGTGTVSFA